MNIHELIETRSENRPGHDSERSRVLGFQSSTDASSVRDHALSGPIPSPSEIGRSLSRNGYSSVSQRSTSQSPSHFSHKAYDSPGPMPSDPHHQHLEQQSLHGRQQYYNRSSPGSSSAMAPPAHRIEHKISQNSPAPSPRSILPSAPSPHRLPSVSDMMDASPSPRPLLPGSHSHNRHDALDQNHENDARILALGNDMRNDLRIPLSSSGSIGSSRRSFGIEGLLNDPPAAIPTSSSQHRLIHGINDLAQTSRNTPAPLLESPSIVTLPQTETSDIARITTSRQDPSLLKTENNSIPTIDSQRNLENPDPAKRTKKLTDPVKKDNTQDHDRQVKSGENGEASPKIPPQLSPAVSQEAVSEARSPNQPARKKVKTASATKNKRSKVKDSTAESPQSHTTEPVAESAAVELTQPLPARRIQQTPPIWAQSIRDVPLDQLRASRQQKLHALPQSQSNVNPVYNGHIPPNIHKDHGPLGLWEPSIMNVIPVDEITRVVSDFLFVQAMQHPDMPAIPGLGDNPPSSAVLEIEAKIGRLMDKNTNDRLRLPCLTETVLNREDPNIRTSFESSMTEKQHGVLNGFLNQALIQTRPADPPSETGEQPQNPRNPIKYHHSYEIDSFYPLTKEGLLLLPPKIAAFASVSRGGSRPSIRITRDHETGEVLAQMVKTRVADVDVYSPMTNADWRVSVNIEMSLPGSLNRYIDMEKGKDSSRSDRFKNRLTYKHQAYQIDMTQLVPQKQEDRADHELEIEVAADQVRNQATLLQSGQHNQFQDLMAGFVNNIRSLVRQVPQDQMPVLR